MIDLATNQGDITGTVDIGIQGEKADVTVRTLHATVFRQAFDGDHIHIMGVMNRRTHIRLGHHHQPAMGNVLGHFFMGRDELIRIGIAATGARQPQAGVIIQL